MTDVAVLPLPIEFELPGPSWQRVDPRAFGVPTAAFMAIRLDSEQAYNPVLTVSGGFRRDPASLDDIADESLELLRAELGEAEVVKRRSVGNANAPAVLQLLGATGTVDGHRRDLRQVQVIEAIQDIDDPGKRVVLIFTMTGTYAQSEELAEEFETFMESVVVLPGVN